ncbi:MAG: ketopantoate reductase family protein [Rectinemataceae bacterium]|jgi:2-dehydropantoate 2-reductase
MREIRSALILGAGAVGAAVASVIHKNEPGSVGILADPSRMSRYRAEGLIVNGERMDFPLVDSAVPPARGEESDLVILAVKSHHLARAISDMAPFVGDRTLILSLLNGITSEDELAAAFGRARIPYAMILGIDALREGNATSFAAAGKIYFGDARNEEGAWSERVSRIAAFFDRTGVGYVVPEDMVRSLWYKFMINVGINQVSAVLRAPYGTFQRLPEAKEAMEGAMRELIAVSRAKGTGLTEADLVSWYVTLQGFSPDSKTSMLQDVEAGRKTEVEAFAGVVIALGEETGVPTPVNRLLFNLIRTMERSYR